MWVEERGHQYISIDKREALELLTTGGLIMMCSSNALCNSNG